MEVPDQISRLLSGDISGMQADAPQTIDRVFADWLVLGPGFFRRYVEGSELANFGDRAMFRIPQGDPPELLEVEGRVLRENARMLPLVHPELEAIMARYREGEIRAATKDERQLFYAMIDFELDDDPVLVIQATDGRLLIYPQQGGRIHWLEYLDAWQRRG